MNLKGCLYTLALTVFCFVFQACNQDSPQEQPASTAPGDFTPKSSEPAREQVEQSQLPLAWESCPLPIEVCQHAELRLIDYQGLPLIVYEDFSWGADDPYTEIGIIGPVGMQSNQSEGASFPNPGFSAEEFYASPLADIIWDRHVLVTMRDGYYGDSRNCLAVALTEHLLDIAFVDCLEYDFSQNNLALKVIRLDLAEPGKLLEAPAVCTNPSGIKIVGLGTLDDRIGVIYARRQDTKFLPQPAFCVQRPRETEEIQAAFAVNAWPEDQMHWQQAYLYSVPRDISFLIHAGFMQQQIFVLTIPPGYDKLVYGWLTGPDVLDHDYWRYDDSLPAPELDRSHPLVCTPVGSTWGIAYSSADANLPNYYCITNRRGQVLLADSSPIAPKGTPVQLVNWRGRPLVAFSRWGEDGFTHSLAWADSAEPKQLEDWAISAIGNLIGNRYDPVSLAIVNDLPALVYPGMHNLMYTRANETE